MLERIKTRVNRRGIFKIGRIVRGGSGAEKTSIWKIRRRLSEESQYYLEFDFLAALENAVKDCIDQTANCPGCIEIVKTPVDKERLRQCYDGDHILNAGLMYHDDSGDIFSECFLESRKVISNIFIKEINYCLTSSCDCLTYQCHEPKDRGYKISLRPSSVEHKHGCGECAVDMTTGTLHVNTEMVVEQRSGDPNQCSLIFKWISKAKSLSVPDELLLHESQLLSTLPILVDFLPVLESLKTTSSGAAGQHDYFIVPKRCNVCGGDYVDYRNRWRKSWCMAEIDAFTTKMSYKHKRCYQVIKYLLATGIFLPNYHIKTVVLNHHTTCADTTDYYVDCVIGMLRELLQAHETKELLSYQSNLNIIKGDDFVERKKNDCELLIHKLCSVSATDNWATFIKTLR